MTAQLLTAEQLAERWQVPKSHIYRLAREWKIPNFELGRYRRWSLEAIEQFERDGGGGVSCERVAA
jgi:excisionase family DNA binding protein